MSRLALIATGGTIAGKGESTRYTAAQIPADELFAGVPELAALARWHIEQPFALDSRDMLPAYWLLLAERCRLHLADDGIDGIVITHGTDTLEETAFALELLLHADKPVIMTAAMRPATAPDADGPANLLAAARAALDVRNAGGVAVAMHGELLAATQIVKSHTQSLQAFTTRQCAPPRSAVHFALGVKTTLPRVDILYCYAGCDADAIEHRLSRGARGLVVAAAGHGSLPQALLPALRKAVATGIPVVRASRVADGRVEHGHNTDDDAEGWIAARGLTPLQARILLMLSLAAGRQPAADFASF